MSLGESRVPEPFPTETPPAEFQTCLCTLQSWPEMRSQHSGVGLPICSSMLRVWEHWGQLVKAWEHIPGGEQEKLSLDVGQFGAAEDRTASSVPDDLTVPALPRATLAHPMCHAHSHGTGLVLLSPGQSRSGTAQWGTSGQGCAVPILAKKAAACARIHSFIRIFPRK